MSPASDTAISRTNFKAVSPETGKIGGEFMLHGAVSFALSRLLFARISDSLSKRARATRRARAVRDNDFYHRRNELGNVSLKEHLDCGYFLD